MKKLITISREYGSGGRIIGKLLAEKLNIPFYDKEIIEKTACESGFCPEIIECAELKAKSGLAYTLSAALSVGDNIAMGNMSMSDKIFLAQFQAIKEIGESGEGVIVGRCADYVLKDMPGVTNVFIYGEYDDRIYRTEHVYGESHEEAKKLVDTYDKARQNYYSYHTGQKWGEFKNYNLAINSSYISEEKAMELIAEYVETRTY